MVMGAPALDLRYLQMSNETIATQTSGQLIRYALVGIASNLVGYLVYLLITFWGVEPKKTMTLLYIVGATTGYFGNRQWAFAHNGAVLWSGVRYLMAHLCGYLINLYLLMLFADDLGYPHQYVQAAAIVAVAGFLFLAFKYFVFPTARAVQGGKK